LAGVIKGEDVTAVGWQVTLCDHVSSHIAVSLIALLLDAFTFTDHLNYILRFLSNLATMRFITRLYTEIRRMLGTKERA